MGIQDVLRATARIFSSRLAQAILGLAVGGACLYFASQGVDWPEVREILAGALPVYTCLAFTITIINIALKIVRWRLQLSQDGVPLPLLGIAASFLSAQMLNAMIPVRLGEVQRIYVMGGSGSTHGFVLGTILAEKFLDLLAYAVLIVVLLLWIPLPGWLESPARALVALTLALALFLSVLALKRSFLLGLAGRLSRHFSAPVQTYLQKNLQAGLASLDLFRQPARAVQLSLVTALIWATAVITNYWVLLALGIQPGFRSPLAACVLVLVAVQAGISLPSLPGKIGVFELTCLLALEFFGVGRTIALSYGILLHAVVFTSILIPGLASFLYLQIAGPHLATQ